MADPVEPASKRGGDGQLALQVILRDAESHSPYSGQGTVDEPYIVEFLPQDPHNPKNFPAWRKWRITSVVTVSVFAVTLTSSAYSESAEQIIVELNASSELFAAGLAFYVLGFAVGPALWAPLSELYGRHILFVFTLGFTAAFVGATAGCKNIASLLVFRFLAGTFGASPLTNAGGVVADLFPPSQLAVAVSVFAAAPFLGPVLGPIIGGFVTITVGWRWVQGVCCIFVGIVWISGIILVPETYGPVLLRKTTKRLSRETGKAYISVLDKNKSGAELSKFFGRTLKRPWVLLFWEPIVLIASIYLSVLYGTIYMFLPAYPIVYEENRGWNAGIGSLPFLGLAVGMLLGLSYIIFDNRRRYQNLGKAANAESRLPPGAIGAIALPIGMFGFAWTNSPSIHWSASVIFTVPFGFGCVLVFVSIILYLLDAYTIYAASVLAGGSILRAFIGAAFPLFTTQMFDNLGIHWASSIPAFLTVACLPFPFVMYKYGTKIRMKCKYAHEAVVLMARMQAESEDRSDEDGSNTITAVSAPGENSPPESNKAGTLPVET